jgi:hypothetical protein
MLSEVMLSVVIQIVATCVTSPKVAKVSTATFTVVGT